jgi:hypothetical protein
MLFAEDGPFGGFLAMLDPHFLKFIHEKVTGLFDRLYSATRRPVACSISAMPVHAL